MTVMLLLLLLLLDSIGSYGELFSKCDFPKAIICDLRT